MKKTFLAILALVMMLLSNVAAASLPPELADAASQGRLLSLETWNPNFDVSLICATVFPPGLPKGGRSDLFIYQGARHIFSCYSLQSPISMFTIGGEAGNLATIWEAGDGTYILCVFAFEGGKVRKVLEASSKLMPEFVYAPTAPGSLLVDSTQTVPGGYWSQRIVIANMDWVHDAKSSEREYLPITADIFTWDGKRYQAHERVKWVDRLK